MALAGEDNAFDPNDVLNEKVLQGIRAGSEASRFNPGRPTNVKQVSADEQRAKVEAVEERDAEVAAKYDADKAAIIEQLASGEIQGTDEFEARFNDALTGAVEAKAGDVALAPPNPWTSTAADRYRHEERVRADERAKLAEAAKPAEEAPDELETGYFDNLGETDDDTVDVEAVDDADDDASLYYGAEDDSSVWDPWAPDEGVQAE